MQAYKNLSLTKKLILSMLIITALGVIIGAVGGNGMSRLNEEDEEMYLYNTLPMEYLATMYDTLASQRICANNMVIFREADPTFAQEEGEALYEKEELFDEAFQSYGENILASTDDTTVEQGLYNEMKKLYYGEFATIKANVRSAVASGDAQAMADAIAAMDSMGSDVSGYMDEAFVLNGKFASDKVAANKDLYRNNTITLTVLTAVSAIC
ncbi:MCP four helix bundle domain-containing protein, partial [Ruminococcaceae bacterium OttesenSCG-928-L11]|nr:MCP four helix bundle domain-containing protein [Ruminococcaceae bacterium OttesenSCG-928-L11]